LLKLENYQDVLSVGDYCSGYTNCGTSRQWNIVQCEKEIIAQAIKRHGEARLDGWCL
jgi:hypothetical protein